MKQFFCLILLYIKYEIKTLSFTNKNLLNLKVSKRLIESVNHSIPTKNMKYI